MCGIAGIFFFRKQIKGHSENQMKEALKRMSLRGPDNNAIYQNFNTILGHSRLSIIDVSENAAQPFSDSSGRYTVVFNGMIYNFRELRKNLKEKGFQFKSASDTEVLLYLYINKGEKCLEELNGFFSFAIYDNLEKSIFIARDRYGIKPFYYYHDDDRLVFASEMKALMHLDIPKKIDKSSLFTYLQFNYIPGTWSIFENVRKLSPGHYLYINKSGKVQEKQYYSLPEPSTDTQFSYESYEGACQKLFRLLEDSVLKRLVSDVPLGAFLSGGIDSSIITALAAKHVNKLSTFSIGFKDEAMFDETRYANMVSRMHNTDHTVFSLSNDDLFNCLFDVLNYIDEPFADSSALAVYILSKETRKKVTVALSGDGADELFAGYNKHMAEYRALNPGFKESLAALINPLLSRMPKSRNNPLSNTTRQIARFVDGMNLDAPDRYWLWCSLANEQNAVELLKNKNIPDDYYERKSSFLNVFDNENININNTLYADVKMVLPYDMLTKVDLMSMANSLEVRVPFLDHKVVDYVASMPGSFKIDNKARKKILKDTFSQLLPEDILKRSKHGFEVPLLKWFRNELSDFINNDVLEDDFIEEQNIFDPRSIRVLKQQLRCSNPGDSPARIWGLIVFQQWWKNYFG